MSIGLSDISDRLPRVPDHFQEQHWEIAQAVAGVMLRDRHIDEAVWLQIIRYATQHVIWAELVFDLATDEDESAKGFGSMKVQRLAYQEKILGQMERELFLTPNSRHASAGTAQTSFMDLLEQGNAVPANGPADGAGGVTPFRPRRRAIGG